MAKYFLQINANPHFTLRYVSPLLKRALKEQQPTEGTGMKLGGITYSVGFDPQRMRLALRWEESGERHEQSIEIVAEPSNIRSLSGSYVYYFLCPLTGTKCRILYKMEEGGFCSRKALPRALYPLQIESKKWRYMNYPPEEKEPYRRQGKRHYRGKPTPYGKRCQRWEAAKDRQHEAFINGISKLFTKHIK